MKDGKHDVVMITYCPVMMMMIPLVLVMLMTSVNIIVMIDDDR